MTDIGLTEKDFDRLVGLVRESEQLQIVRRLVLGKSLPPEVTDKVLSVVCGWTDAPAHSAGSGDAGMAAPPKKQEEEQKKESPNPEEKQKEKSPDPEESREEKCLNQKAGNPDKKEGKRKLIDRGKVAALKNAGWSVKDIADEMRCSDKTIYYVLKKLEETKDENLKNETGELPGH